MSEHDRTAHFGDPALRARGDGLMAPRKQPSIMYSQYRSTEKSEAPPRQREVPAGPSSSASAFFRRSTQAAEKIRSSTPGPALSGQMPSDAAQGHARDGQRADPDKPGEQQDGAQAGQRIPLVDLRSVIQVGWSYRPMVMVLAVAGAVGGAGFALTIPKKYSAIATLYFDPTSIRTVSEGQEVSVPSEVVKATIDSQTKIIGLDSVIKPVVLKLRLAADPAFGGKSTEEVVGTVKKAIKVTRAADTYITEVKVTTGSASRSASIANALVKTFLEQDQNGKLDKYASINSVFQGRLDELRRQVESSEGAVERYRSSNDLVQAEGELIADKRLTALNELLVTTQQATIAAKSKLDSASRIDVSDVVNGTLKEAVASSTLGSLRVQYANLSTNLGRLESQLGARHPSLIAARASTDTLKGEIRHELSRMVSGAKDEYDQAAKAEKDLRSELAVQKALQSTSSPEVVQLKELERKATAAKELYEAVLKRAGETTEEKNLFQSNIRVVSEAVVPLSADPPGRSTLGIAGLFGGAMFGLLAGVMLALLRNSLWRRGPSDA